MEKKKASSTCDESRGDTAFEELDHTADRALRVYGLDMGQLLINAACGLNSLLAPEFAPGAARCKVGVQLEALDAESLLVEWLSELAYRAESERLVFDEFELQEVSPTRIRAILWGRPAARLERDIKAVTYHNLKIVQTEKGLTATVVLDV